MVDVECFAFFVGTNGSGTTLHRAIFDCHPDLAIPAESHFITRFAKNRARYERTDGLDGGLLLEDLSHDRRFLNWGLDEQETRNVFNAPGVDNYPEAIRALYRLYARTKGKTRYGDKTQAYIHELPLLAELFPEARFVHAVRDGRDVALAHAEGAKIEQVAMSWKRRVEAGRKAGEKLGPHRYIESRYEDLIDDPEGSMRRLCPFLDLEFDPVMLKYYERADDIVSTTAVPERHKDIFLPPTKGLQDWRRDLSDNQVMRFEALAGDLLDELGYERAFTTVPFGPRLAAWRGLASDGVKYTVRRARKMARLG